MAEKSKSQISETTIERKMIAPIEIVWEMWTDAKHVAQWWGLKGFRNPVCQWTAKPADSLLIHMEGPDGIIYPMNGEFKEIVKHKKIIFVSGALDEKGKRLFEILHTITFNTQLNSTLLTIYTKIIKTEPGAEKYLNSIHEGWNESLDKLENHLSRQDRELLFERILNAPQDLVFEVLTDPEHLAKWWGPDGFSLSTLSMDAKKNGIWKFIMHGPDGRDYKNKIQYLDMVKPTRIAYQHLDDDDTEGVSFHVTMTLDKVFNRTKLTMKMTFKSAEDLQYVAKEYGAIEGAHQTLGRLELLVGDLSPFSANEIVTTRTFEASVEKVFNAWTDPSILSKWWGPKGFTNTFHLHELFPGGNWNFTMHGPNGGNYENKCIYIHIDAPHLLIWHHKGGHNFHVVTSFQEIEGKTKVTFKMIFDSKEECQQTKVYAIEKNEENMDRLESHL